MERENNKDNINLIKNTDYLKQRKVICPITFVEGKVSPSKEMNHIFTLPYDTTTMTNYHVKEEAKHIIKNSEFDSKEDAQDFAHDVWFNNMKTLKESIISYISMNVDDVIRAFYFKVIDRLYSLSNDIKYRAAIESLNYHMASNYNDTITIASILNTLKDDINNTVAYIRFNDIAEVNTVLLIGVGQKIFNRAVSYMNTLFSGEITSYISRNFPEEDHISIELIKMMSDGVSELDALNAAKKVSSNLRYNIIASHVREILDSEFPSLYGAIMDIVTNGSKFADINLIDNFKQIPEALNNPKKFTNVICGGIPVDEKGEM